MATALKAHANGPPLNPTAPPFSMPEQTDQTSSGPSPTPTSVNGTSKPQKKKDAPDKGISSSTVGEKGIASPGEQKLTGAELKKQKAAEKAARRKEKVAERGEAVQVVQTQVQTHNQPQPPQLQRRQSTGKKDGAPITQHKRTGSSSGKALPLRGTAAVVPPEPDTKLKDEKRVAFFSHLYPKEKRTSIAGASKEIHPAVLALGLQLRDHIICGGNARCVATLLVFKKVGSITSSATRH
jgi:translation initiation factor eIF-2B subunit delta